MEMLPFKQLPIIMDLDKYSVNVVKYTLGIAKKTKEETVGASMQPYLVPVVSGKGSDIPPLPLLRPLSHGGRTE